MMYKYIIMIIDDEIDRRYDNLEKFFSNKFIDTLPEERRNAFKKKIPWEFNIIYPDPQRRTILDEYIKTNHADAFFIDVNLESQEMPYKWDLNKAFSAIKQYNPNAPIFMYSQNWKDGGLIEKVSRAFRESFCGKTAVDYYDSEKIYNSIKCLEKDVLDVDDLDDLVREREYIKNIIALSDKNTTLQPHSAENDIVILHISDIQYGDKNFTSSYVDLCQMIVNKSIELQKNKRISGVDLAVITGDITMHGLKEEFDKAKKDLTKNLFKKLWADDYSERILIVPGNHDYDLNYCTLEYLQTENKKDERSVDFEKIKKIIDEGKRVNDYHDMGFSAFRDFAFEITNDLTFYQNKKMNYVNRRFKIWGLRFVCLNSNEGICAEETNGISIDSGSLEKIINEKGDKTDETLYTIVLSHHTPIAVNDIKDKKKSESLNKSFKTILRNFEPSLWLGGHHHISNRCAELNAGRICKCYEAPTLSLCEEWMEKLESNKVKTVDGVEIDGTRGFQFIILHKNDKGYDFDIIRYVFDEDGNPFEVLKC